MPKENPSINIPDPTVEVIAERRKNKRPKRFDHIPSSIEGVELIAEPGTKPEFTKHQTRKLQADSDRIVRKRKYDSEEKAARSRLIYAANDVPGFRGISSERGNYELPIVPSEHYIYDPDLLRSSTGEYHRTLVREKGELGVNLEFGSDEDSKDKLLKFARAVERIMVEEMGMDAEEVGDLISLAIVQRLDEERLNELIKEGKIKLKSKTRRKTTTWSTRHKPIEKKTKPKRQRKLTDKK